MPTPTPRSNGRAPLFAGLLIILVVALIAWRWQTKSGGPKDATPPGATPVGSSSTLKQPDASASGTASAQKDKTEASGKGNNTAKQINTPGKKRLPDFSRRETTVPSLTPKQSIALEGLRKRVPGVSVDFDPISGSPSNIVATGRFLAQPKQVGAEPNAAVVDFMDSNADLFGGDASSLKLARVMREDVTAHNGMRTTVWQQEVDGIPVYNTILKANVTKDGALVAIGSHFLQDAVAATSMDAGQRAALASHPPLDVVQAVVLAAANVGDKIKPEQARSTTQPSGAERKQNISAPSLSDTVAQLSWLPTSANSMRLTWDVTLMSIKQNEMFRVLVDAQTGDVLQRTSLTNDISNASYRVYADSTSLQPFDSPAPMSPGLNTPTSNQAAAVSRNLVSTSALDTTASPNGWIDDGGTATYGNNVDAHLDAGATNPTYGNGTHATSATRVFDFPIDLSQAPSSYQSAVITSLFYACNWYHDRMYAFGFTESAGNFQQSNFGRGGIGNDAVLADAQDGSGTNNANFSTPADGSPGRMQMYVFTGPTPDIDGDLDMEIVFHEHTHGLSNRLVGGGVGISALQTGGMGEGWSDFYALCLLSQPGDDVNGNYAAGGYATYQLSGLTSNYYYGIRRYPYTTDMTKNPLTLKDIDPTKASAHSGVPHSPIFSDPTVSSSEVHNQGEVWCVTLWDVRANLINKLGATAGNNMAIQLVTDGMKLSPANPTFLQARDAIVQADLVDNGGANKNELWVAFAKRGMGASASVPANSTTTGVVEAYDIPDNLGITPNTVFAVTGQVGGPFTPSSQTYTLTNIGSSSLNWTASVNQTWMSVSPASGTLAAGANTTVTVTITAAASSVSAGSFTGNTSFTNLTSGAVLTRQASLTVTPPRLAYFDLATDPGWTRQGEWAYGTPAGGGGTSHGYHDPTAGATGTKVFGINLAGDYSTSVSGPYYLTTSAFNLTGYSGAQLRFKRWLNCDYPPYVTETVQVSNDATNWATIYTNPSGAVADSSWTTVQYDISAVADNHSTVYIRWGHQVGSSGAFNYSGWNIDDVEILASPTQTLTLGFSPASATEGGDPVTATLTANPAPVADRTVTLTSSDPASASVPATATILAGQTTATFPVTPQDDAHLNGTRNVVITAASSGYASGIGTLPVIDNETAVLAVTAPASTAEGAGTVQGGVSISAAPSVPITITLTSSDTTAVQVPTTIVMPAGQTVANFAIAVVDDTKIDGTQNATITAHVTGWTDGTAGIAVQDNESTALTLALASPVIEGGTGSGTVTIGGTLSSALTVPLVSSNPARLTVPASVNIAAGQTSATFSTTAPQNALQDGNEAVTVTASATAFTSATGTVTVQDDELHHFGISAIGASQVRGTPFAVTVAAKNISDQTITSFAGTLPLSAAGDGGAVTMTPATVSAFTNGAWTGNVTINSIDANVMVTADDGAGHTGASNAFNVGVGALHHFAWSTITSPKVVNQPFSATITAQDSANNTVTTFSGTANLNYTAIGGPSGNVLITEVNPNTPDEIEFTNVGGAAVDMSGWTIHVYDDVSWPSPLNAFTIPAGTTCASGQVFRLQENGTAPGTFPLFSTGANINWTASATSKVAVMLRNAAGNIVDFVAVGAATPSSITLPIPVPLAQWSGSVVTATTSGILDYARSSGTDTNGSLDWTVAPVGMGTLNSGLGSLIPALLPMSGSFVNGVWTGNITIPQTVNQTTMVADDAAAHTGTSNPFNVQTLGPLTLTAPSSATEGDAPLTATVSVSAAVAADLTVNLTSSKTTEAIVPATVTIPAGQTSTTFPITIIDDAILDGPQVAVITAAAASYDNGTANLTVLDNEVATITITAPASATEGDGTLTNAITVTSSAAPANDIVITLSSSSTGRATVPAAVTLPAGQTSVSANLTIVNNNLLDGSQSVTLTAAVQGWNSATTDITVNDNELATLAVTTAASFTEGQGTVAGAGTVTIGGVAVTPVVVSLSSSDTTKLTVPSSVTIAAGQSSATFAVTIIDNTLADGAKPVTITATAPTFPDATRNTTVRDNDVGTFSFAAIASQTAAQAFPVTVTARTIDGDAVTSFAGVVNLSVTGATGITPTVSGNFTAGVWTGNVTVLTGGSSVTLAVDDGSGHTGSSAPFVVAVAPVHHFVLSAVASPQVTNAPFSITATAKDQLNATTPYSGTARLMELAPSAATPLAQGATTTSAPLATLGKYAGRTQVLLTPDKLGGSPQFVTGLSLFFTSLPQSIAQWTIRVKPTTMTAFPVSGATWDSTGWTTVYSGPLSTTASGWNVFTFGSPFLYSGQDSLMVDFVFQSNYPPTRSATLSGTTTANPRVLTATTATSGQDPKTWTGTTGSPATSTVAPDVRITSRLMTDASPAMLSGFSAGVWTGSVRVNQPASPTALAVWDTATNAYALSNDFNVTATGSTITLTLSSANTSEGGAPLTGTVSIPSSLGSPLVVTLSSDHPADVTMPATVTIPTGSTSTTFNLSAVDDGLLEGHEITKIEAYAVNYKSGFATVDIADNETSSVVVTLLSSLTEGTSGTATVAVDRAVANDVTVTLDADLTSELTVPTSVVIPSGQSSVTFPITAVNDNILDGNKTVTVNAHIAGINDGSATMQVLDAAPVTIALTVPSPKREGDPVFNATVTLSSPTATNRVINLLSSDTTEAAVPAAVTVLAGQSSVTFPVTIIDDTETDGDQIVTITASSSGLSNGMSSLTVKDNDVDHFALAAIGATQVRNQPFSITVTAKDVNDAVIASNFTGPVTLSADAGGTPVTITPTTTGTFTNGVWTGSVTMTGYGVGVAITAADGGGHSGTSNLFDVTTASLDHFAISTIASPQDANAPFNVTVTAVDSANNSLTGFAGPVSLAAYAAGSGVELITGTGASTASYPLYTGWHDCRTQSIYTPAEVGTARLLTGLALNVSTVPGQMMTNFTIRLKHTTKTDYTGTGNASWEGSGWTTVYQTNQTVSTTGWVPFTFTTPFVYNGSDNLMVDISFNNSSFTSSAATTYTTSTTSRTIYYNTDSVYGDPLTWSGTASPTPNSTTSLPNLKLISSSPLAMTPAASDSFSNGAWTGEVTLNEANAGITLIATGSGKSGASNLFDIAATAGVLNLTLSSLNVNEGDAPVTATLSRSGSRAEDLMVALFSNLTNRATVPPTVTIPAGSASATFPVTIVDNNLLDGTQTAGIVADAPSYARVTQTLTVNDNETAVLAVTLPTTLTEGTAPSGPGTVTVSAAPDAPLLVNLTSSLPARLTVPASVTIPAGSTSATFPITLISNTTLDFAAAVNVTASVPGFTSGTGTTMLYDDEANLTVTLASSTTEGASAFTGTVSVVTAPVSPVTVSISSSNPGKAAVTSSVTIAAGTTSTTFTVTPQDNPIKDGQQTVTLNFAASGYTPKAQSLIVNDNELDHYTFTTTMPSSIVRNATASVTVTAKDINGVTIPTFAGTVNLSAANGSGSVTMTPATATLASGTATFSAVFTQAGNGVTLTATDGQGITGSTNSFNVTNLGAQTKFLWSTITSPKSTDSPFSVTLTAADAGNNTITSYNGPASLRGLATSGDLIVGTGTSSSPSFPLPTNLNSRTQSIYLASEMGTAKRLTNLQFNVAISSSSTFSNFTVRLKHTAKASYSGSATWDSTGWTTVYTANRLFSVTGLNTIPFTTPFDYDGSSNLMVDVSFNNTTFPSPAYCYYSTATTSRTLYYNTSSTIYGVPTAWSGASPLGSSTTATTNVRFGNQTPFTITPTTTGALASGVWTGNISVRDPGTGIFLNASDATLGISSNSGTFTVNSTGNLGLSVVTPKVEGNGTVANAGTVTLPAAPASNVTVNLVSSDTSVATVPASVTVLAGQTTASFPITIIDDALIDGDQVTVIEASAAGYTRKTASLTVQDNDGGTLTVTAPSEVIESGGSGTATVTASVVSTNARTITLASNNTAKITVPASITLPAGQTSVAFTFTIVDNAIIDGAQTAVITASAAGWTSGSAIVTVQDNESNALTLGGFAGTLTEGGTGFVTVSLPSGVTGPATVNLSSSDTSIASVPATVTIPSGSSSATVTATFPENSAPDGAHTAYIICNANGFIGSGTGVTVADNDLHHFAISTVSSPQIAGAPFSVTIQAVTFDGTSVTTILPALNLSASSGASTISITPATTGALTGGAWTGTVTIPSIASNVTITASDGSGHTGTSNAFSTAVGPFSKFVWSTIPSPQKVSVPFAATVRAADVGGNTVTTYNGGASLTAYVGPSSVVTGVGTSAIAFPLYTFYQDERTQCIYTPAEVGSARTLTSLALDVSTLPGITLTNFTIRLKHTSKSGYGTAGSASWEGSGWTTVYQANQSIPVTGWNTFNFTTPFSYDGTSNLMVDIIFNNNSYGSGGFVRASATSTSRSIYYYTDSGYGDPLTWSGTSNPTPSTSTYLPNLKFNGTPLLAAPASITFANGVWSGNVTTAGVGTGVVLEAVSGNAAGGSNAFNVDYLGTLALVLPNSAKEGDAPVTATVTISGAPSTDISVNLSSSDMTAATLPNGVIIPAGQTSATFPVAIIDDSLLDGPQVTTITATSPGYATASSTFTVNDRQTATITVTMPVSVTEGQGTLADAGTVTLSQAPDADITVNLSTSDPASLSLPSTVVIAAGTTSKTFSVTVGDDTINNGTRSIVSTAHVSGWNDATATTIISDNETTLDWPTYGNGPSHTGYQPGVLGAASFTAGWTVAYPTSTSGLNQVAVGAGNVFVTPLGDGFVSAVDAMSGFQRWRYTYANAPLYGVDPPTYWGGGVFVQRGHSIAAYGDASLWSFNSTTGAVNWSALFGAQGERYFAPTVFGGNLWMDGGTYGGLYGFNTADGSQKFFNSTLDQYDQWTPAYYNGTVYTWMNGKFRAHDPVTGIVQWTLILSTGYPYSVNSAPAVDGGRAFVVGNPNLYAVDLTGHSSPWNATGSFKGSAAVANGIVYAISADKVNAYSAQTGAAVGVYTTGDAGITGQPVVTTDSVIVSSSSATYLFNLGSFTLRQTLPKGGPVSLAGNILYLAGTDGVLRSYFPSGTPYADLGVSQTINPTTAGAGATVTITLNVSNSGPSAADSAVVEDRLPSGLTYVSSTSTVGTCTQTGGVVTCLLGSLASGANATVTITAVANGSVNQTNLATISSATYDPNGTNNSNSAILNLVNPPTVATLAASAITTTGATLNGTVNANGFSSTVAFDYGTSTSYGTSAAGTPSPVTGSTNTPVSKTLSGLTPGTTYHYRVDGTNVAGTTNGSDISFTTINTNANLSGLVLSSGTLAPSFSGSITSYTASVTYTTSSITITPYASDYLGATMKVNGVSVVYGSASTPVALNIGSNTINTVVTAQDGVTTKTYTVVVTRATPSATFTSTGVMTSSRLGNMTALLGNGKVLVAGGTSSSILATAELYDPATGVWTSTGSMITPRYQTSALLLPNGKVLVAGGAGSAGALASAELYDPSTETWSATGSLHAIRRLHSTVLLPNGKVLVAGGFGSSTLASAELYDPTTGIWTAINSMSTARYYAASALMPNGKVIVAGGLSNTSTALNSSEIYDPSAGTWSTVSGAMNTARYYHSLTVLPNGKLIAVGGYNGSSYLTSAELYDPAASTWSATASTSTIKYFHSASLLPNGKLLLAGGASSGAEFYDYTTGTWSSTGSLTATHSQHTATILPGGRVLIAGGAGTVAEIYNPNVPSFNPTNGNMSAAREYLTTTLLPGGKVLAVGGTNSSGQNTSAEMYNPASGSWTSTGALATKRYSHSATLLSNGKVLVAGGYNDTNGRLASAELYDPGTGSWSTTGSLPTVRVSFTATLLPNGKVLTAGGHNAASTTLAELYNPTTGVWTATGALIKDRENHTATLLPNGKVLIAAGWSNIEGSLKVAETYDPASATWSATGSLANVRDSHTATLLPNGKVLVAGGYTSVTFSTLGSCELFDPASGTWSSTGSLATARKGHTATLLPDGKVLVVGGMSDYSTPLSSAELYDPASGTWSTVPSLIAARLFHGAALLPNGNVLLVGGYNFTSYLASSELFDAGSRFSDTWRPLVSSAPASIVSGNALVLTGSGFRGVSGASSGTHQDAATNCPVVQLRTLDGGMSVFLPSSPTTNWSDTTFTSSAVNGLPYGHALATVFTNGIPGVSSVVDIVSSNNVNLSGLVISSAPLSPAFASGTTSYTSTVPYTTTSVTVTATLADSTSSLKINGITVTSGSASGAISLTVGSNTINTVVTAQDGVTTRTYTAVVTRTAPSANANLTNLSLSAGTLSPVFAGGTTSYTTSVVNATTSITATPTLADTTATININGNTVNSGSASSAINLAQGSNTVDVVVTAQDSSTKKTYTVTVTRNTPYQDWASSNGLTGPNSAPSADANGNGIPNMLEWAFGTNPGISGTPAVINASGGVLNSRGQPVMTQTPDGSGGMNRFAEFGRRKDAAASGLSYVVEFTYDLTTWVASTDTPTVVASDAEIEAVTVPFPPLVNGQPPHFFRVKVLGP